MQSYHERIALRQKRRDSRRYRQPNVEREVPAPPESLFSRDLSSHGKGTPKGAGRLGGKRRLEVFEHLSEVIRPLSVEAVRGHSRGFGVLSKARRAPPIAAAPNAGSCFRNQRLSTRAWVCHVAEWSAVASGLFHCITALSCAKIGVRLLQAFNSRHQKTRSSYFGKVVALPRLVSPRLDVTSKVSTLCSGIQEILRHSEDRRLDTNTWPGDVFWIR